MTIQAKDSFKKYTRDLHGLMGWREVAINCPKKTLFQTSFKEFINNL
jgi:hypothetical protein